MATTYNNPTYNRFPATAVSTVLVSQANTADLVGIGPGTNGQLIIGSTGVNPVFASLTSSGGTIAFTAGAGSLNLEVVQPIFTWAVTTIDASFVVNKGYIANKAGLLTMTLPASASIGDRIAITGINNATGWKIAQNANQIIHIGTSDTTTGVGGSLASSQTRDSIDMICVVSGASTEWNVTNFVGNITIV